MGKELGPIEEYLRDLRASLRTPADQTSRILAEAEDHLSDSMAAGLAAGLTETEAAQAAISSFGSVRAVVRAHQTRRGVVADVLGDLTMTAGVSLLLVFAIALVIVAVLAIGPHHPGPARPDDDGSVLTVFLIVASGPAGLIVLGGYFLVSRLLRRRGRRPAAAPVDGRAPLAGVVAFGATFVALSLLNALGVSFTWLIPVWIWSLVMTVVCAVRSLRPLLHQERA
jgi:hypothetical protein